MGQQGSDRRLLPAGQVLILSRVTRWRVMWEDGRVVYNVRGVYSFERTAEEPSPAA
jgi:hypothetical protein